MAAAIPRRCKASKRSDSSRLQDHARDGQTLQHQDVDAAQRQFDGGQESDRPGADNHNIGDNIDLGIHILYPNMYSVHI